MACHDPRQPWCDRCRPELYHQPGPGGITGGRAPLLAVYRERVEWLEQHVHDLLGENHVLRGLKAKYEAFIGPSLLAYWAIDCKV